MIVYTVYERGKKEERKSRKGNIFVSLSNILTPLLPLQSDPLDGILEGFLTLINIYIPSKGLISSKSSYNKQQQAYKDVKATFCSISWEKQAEDPSQVPMFRDLKDASPLCSGTTVTVDLWQVARKATDYDNRNHTFIATPPKPGQGPVHPTAVVFHETRCGSTLIANLFASFAPKHTRVYSESPPPVAALKACENNRRCDEGAQEALIRDVFYMMGRVTRVERPQYVFYKIQSVGVHSISAFTKAMPDVPWMFAYRDSVEIMMSHFKNYQFSSKQQQQQDDRFLPVCLRNYRAADRNQPLMLQQLVSDKDLVVSDLSKEDYCSAHLASLAASAIQEYKKVSQGAVAKRWFINYNQLPHIIWEKVLPGLGITIETNMMERMKQVAHVYSKGRGVKAGEHFEEDSTMKQDKAPDVVKKAAAEFLVPVYEQLEAIKAKQQ
jgi:hypothetical protein